MPNPECIAVTGASCHEGIVFDQTRPELNHNKLNGDKAYQRSDAKDVRETQDLTVSMPFKNKKANFIWSHKINGYQPPLLEFDSRLKLYSIGLNNKKVLNVLARSYKGLMVHIFGELAAAMFFLELFTS